MEQPLIATYRVQLTPTFGFAAVRGILPDLAALGVSHVYLSPVAEAVTGSQHGYDVVDPSVVRAELGGDDELGLLAEAAHRLDLGLVVDIVPNHVSTVEAERNQWWWKLLRDGRAGPTSPFFDVDWDAGDERVIVPILGSPLDDEIAAGTLVVDDSDLRYHDRLLPLRPDVDVAGADLRTVLDRQHYRLVEWRSPERNLRRFFTIDDLVAIRPEVAEVADSVHHIVRDLASQGRLAGVRVDHVDGLADPAGYLRTLRAAIGDERLLLVEKIVVGDERLPADWPVDGTTGYEWIRLVDHLFTHPAGEGPITEAWVGESGHTRSYEAVEEDGIRHVLLTALRPDLDRVARAGAEQLGVDAGELVGPLIELTVHLGRYRTYLPAPGVDTDHDALAEDVMIVRRAAGALTDPLATRLVDAILAGGELTQRWQQLTGPALAKGGEDRALYRWFRLAAHNEVGGDPGRWTTTIDEFHEHNTTVAGTTPGTLLAGSTHDTKRSEDARARLLVLAELAPRWIAACDGWRPHVAAPDGPSFLLAAQTAVAAWPIDEARLGDYLVKAAREAGELTTWTEPDDGHETALRTLARQFTTGEVASLVESFVAELAPSARAVSLAQLVLRLTAPGIPDLYQGSESWLHTLVDPDNRAPIDPSRLRDVVASAGDGDVWTAPAPKAAVVARTLAARRRHVLCFGEGATYEPLLAHGRFEEHVVAFVRSSADGGDDVVTVASRFPSSRPSGWDDTVLEIPAGPWHDALSGRRHDGASVPLDRLLGPAPAAVLERA